MTRYKMSVIVDNIFTTRMRDRLTADQVNSVHSSRTMKLSMKKTVTAVNAVVTLRSNQVVPVREKMLFFNQVTRRL